MWWGGASNSSCSGVQALIKVWIGPQFFVILLCFSATLLHYKTSSLQQHYLLLQNASCLVSYPSWLALPSSLPLSVAVLFFSLSCFWPRCRLWHRFVPIPPVPPFHKSKHSRLLCRCRFRQTGEVGYFWKCVCALAKSDFGSGGRGQDEVRLLNDLKTACPVLLRTAHVATVPKYVSTEKFLKNTVFSC